MTKDEKAEKLIEIISNHVGCNDECCFLVGCDKEFVLNATGNDWVRYCRLQLLKWFRGEK